MKINILTIFPNMFDSFKNESIIKRALKNKIIEINVINIRDYCFDKHKQTDDTPYGGGYGMVMKIEPIARALKKLSGKVIYPSPQGIKFNQNVALKLSNLREITFICGHYEGIDERIIQKYVDLEISIGDYVLTGGELASMVISDAIIRLIPNVIKKESYENDSFFNGLLDYPQYTKPYEYEGMKVPDILLSGHHLNISKWRLKESLKNTLYKRKDLLENRKLSELEKKLLKEIKEEKNEK